jgi:hypothetical protein
VQEVDFGTGVSLLWTLAAMIWTPLVLINAFCRPRATRRQPVPVLIPCRLWPDESDRLPALLMENPGAFFVPQRSIRHVHRGRRHWRIDRREGTALLIRPLSDAAAFRTQFAALLPGELVS